MGIVKENRFKKDRIHLFLIPDDLNEIQLIKCPRCHHRFIHSMHTVCPICKKEKDDTFIIER